MSRTLDETHNLLHLYAAHIGTSEVPEDLHLWAFLAGVAACVSDRVWIVKHQEEKVTPALYTFLIAPSARGKGIACDKISNYLNDVPGMNIYSGAVTAERLMEMLTNTTKKRDAPANDKGKLFLMMEEFGTCVSGIPQAHALVKFMTGAYKSNSDVAWRKETVASATAAIKRGCLNWLCGSTKEWLVDAVPQNSIQGGFVGRIACCYIAKAVADVRIWQPTVPPDYAELKEHIHMRFQRLAEVEGEFKRSERAARLEEHWYKTRPAPANDQMASTWIRQHDLLIKLSMILAMCDAKPPHYVPKKIILHQHTASAQRLVARSYNAASYLLDAAALTPETKRLDQVRGIIKDAGALHLSTLVRMAGKRGIMSYELNACLEALKAGKEIEAERINKATVVSWRKRRRS